MLGDLKYFVGEPDCVLDMTASAYPGDADTGTAAAPAGQSGDHA
jgi:hypothetical protein